MQKPPRITLAGIELAEVRTPLAVQQRRGVITSTGSPHVTVREEGDRLFLSLAPLTIAQLWFDGVLPGDRDTPIEIRVGRRPPSRWHITSLGVGKDRWERDVAVLGLDRVP